MTYRIYDKDCNIFEFSAIVLSCTKNGDFYDTVLDKTAFFPNAGGQSCDTGKIGDTDVCNMRQENGTLIHVCKEPLEEGKEYFCSLNKEERLSKMRSHTSEHIISSFFAKTKGAKNVGFHLGTADTTCDFDCEITKDDITSCEDYVNAIIRENHPVSVIFPSENQIKNINYRSKAEIDGQVRLIGIGESSEIDLCACCAPHVSTTGQIGLLRITDFYRYKGGTRIHLLSGEDALRYDRDMENGIKILSRELSSKPNSADVVSAVNRLNEENRALKQSVLSLYQRLTDEICSKVVKGIPFVYIGNDASRDFLLRLCQKASEISGKTCAVFADTGAFAISGGEAQSLYSFLKEKISLRGGGKDIICGTAQAKTDEIVSAIKAVLPNVRIISDNF